MKCSGLSSIGPRHASWCGGWEAHFLFRSVVAEAIQIDLVIVRVFAGRSPFYCGILQFTEQCYAYFVKLFLCKRKYGLPMISPVVMRRPALFMACFVVPRSPGVLF